MYQSPKRKARMNNPFKVLKASLNKDSRRGFLLLEVIMSVFIVTIGVVVVIGSFVTSIRTYKISKAYSELHYLAEEKMWGYEEKGEIEEGGDSGDFDRHEGASWKIKAEELEDFPLNEVDLEITVKDDVSERKYQLATYLRNKEGLF